MSHRAAESERLRGLGGKRDRGRSRGQSPGWTLFLSFALAVLLLPFFWIGLFNGAIMLILPCVVCTWLILRAFLEWVRLAQTDNEWRDWRSEVASDTRRQSAFAARPDEPDGSTRSNPVPSLGQSHELRTAFSKQRDDHCPVGASSTKGKRFPRRFPRWNSPRRELTFNETAWLLFLLFWTLFWFFYCFECFFGIVPHPSTRGLGMWLPSHTLRAVDILRLEKGISYRPKSNPHNPGIHHSEPYVLLIVNPDGKTTWKEIPVDFGGPLPWMSGERAEARAPILIRPMPGVTYADVVAVLDWVRLRSPDDHRVGQIHLVRCEPDPVFWDLRDNLPPTDPIDRFTDDPPPDFPRPNFAIEDTFIPDPPTG